MKIKEYLSEGTGYNPKKEKVTTAHIMNTAIGKTKKVYDLIMDTESIDPLFYIGLTGEIKRLHLALDHIMDLIEEYKGGTGERY